MFLSRESIIPYDAKFFEHEMKRQNYLVDKKFTITKFQKLNHSFFRSTDKTSHEFQYGNHII